MYNYRDFMTDRLTQDRRSWLMSRIRSSDTRPEMIVRSALHALGFRYRLHRTDLPGTPDLVFPSRKKVLFVHGCFWHGHRCRMGQAAPKTNVEFWADKIRKNVARDRRNVNALRRQGWGVAIVWECELKKRRGGKWISRVARFLQR